MAKLLSNVGTWVIYRIMQVGKDLQDHDIHLGMAGHGLEYIPSGADGWQLQRDRAWRWDKVLGRRAGAELIGVIHMA